jgi:23S rRNA pseudouridine2605 synthase
VRHREALTTASATGQVTALSLLVSMYLQSVYAASSDEIEIFLSPVASRSRVREAVRGLSATRQIHSLSMDAQTYHFLENGLPEFAELPAPAVTTTPSTMRVEANGTEMERRPTPRPIPRKMQAIRPQPSDAAAIPAAAPIFRRPKHAVPPGGGPAMRPESQPEPRAASAPRPASTGRPSTRPAWQQAAESPARGARSTGKDQSARGDRTARPATGTRPSFPPKRTFSSPGGERRKTSGTAPERAAPGGDTRAPTRPRPGGAPPDARHGARPGARSGTRPGARPSSRPGARPGGAWTGGAKKEAPKPWALPGRPSGSNPRPPRANARSAASFRPAQKRYDPPSAGAGAPRADADRPRAPRGEPGNPGRARSSRPSGGPQSRPQRPPYVANRSAGPPVGPASSRPSPGFRPRSGSAPHSGKEGPGRPRFGDRKTGFDTPKRRFSPAPGGQGARGAQGARGPAAVRPQRPAVAPTRNQGPSADARQGRGPGYDRPRPGSYGKPGARAGAGSAAGRSPGRGPGRGPVRGPGRGPGKDDRAARPPFVPRSGPPKAGSAKFKPGTGRAPGKPASFRGRKPDRNQPAQ